MKKPMKLIRSGVKDLLKPEEYTTIEDKDQLNDLYRLKILEELGEIRNSQHLDIKEFADLLTVVFSYGSVNGHNPFDVAKEATNKTDEKGVYDNLVLTNLNPENPSNKLYFEQADSETYNIGFETWMRDRDLCLHSLGRPWRNFKLPINWPENPGFDNIPIDLRAWYNHFLESCPVQRKFMKMARFKKWLKLWAFELYFCEAEERNINGKRYLFFTKTELV